MGPTNWLLLTVMLGAAPNSPGVTDEQVKQAIERAVPVIETDGVAWIENKKCSSCHRVGMMVWSLGRARQRGFAVSDRLDEWFAWALEESVRKNDDGKIVGSTNLEGVAQLLLARQAFARSATRAAELDQLRQLILAGQQSNGAWKPGGQLPGQKRPLEETTDVTTLWLTQALVATRPANAEPTDAHQQPLALAEKRIAASLAGKSAEWYVARLLLAHEQADDAATTRLTEQLTSQQQSDGGWGWLIGEESDALATGMSLYALLRAGVPRQDPRIERARQFLVQSQRDDGSWKVKGTKEKKKNRVEETASYWGTAWGVLGLVESLPE